MSATLSAIQMTTGQGELPGESADSRTTEPTSCIRKRGMDWKAAMICCWTADDLLQARGDLSCIEIMEKGEILPLHRLVPLPLDGGRHADAERMRAAGC